MVGTQELNHIFYHQTNYSTHVIYFVHYLQPQTLVMHSFPT